MLLAREVPDVLVNDVVGDGVIRLSRLPDEVRQLVVDRPRGIVDDGGSTEEG